MRNKKLVILVSVVAAMGIATFYLERSEDKQEASRYMRLSVQADQITAVKINRTLNEVSETLDLKKTSEGWIFQNDQMSADAEYIKDLTERIASAEFEEVILVPGQTLDQFRFDKPAAHITITDNLARPNVVIMSDRRNFEGQPYYMLNQENSIYTLSTDLDKKIMSKTILFQDKHVFRKQDEEFIKIQVQSLNHKFDILKNKNLDKTKVTAFVSKIKSLTVQSYLDQSIKAKLVSPVMEVIFSAETLTWSLRLSLNPTDKKLYAETKISGSENKTYYVEYDTSYWEYFSNLNEQQFVKDQK
jgi:hypothetical protein